MLKDALWTGVAIRQYAGPLPVDMRCVYFGGYFVPAMPINPWSKVKDVIAMLETLCTTGGNMSMLFEGSKMNAWGVNTIPITPATHNLPAEVQTRLATTPTRLHNFYPKGLLPHNLGSNEGLAKVIRIQMQDMGLEPPSAPDQVQRYALRHQYLRSCYQGHSHVEKQPLNIHFLVDVRQERWRKRASKISQLQSRVLAFLQTGDQDDMERIREYYMGPFVASHVSRLQVQLHQPFAGRSCHAYGVHGARVSRLQDRA